ncbi:MAG: cytochrome c oxidase assembly protein [Terriglobales bacterium]
MTNFIPYCGSPPFPGHIIWNSDPILGSCFLLALALALRHLVSADASSSQIACFVAGWSVLTFALMSPLCNLSVALFAARAGQHLLVAFLAAPLLALSGAPALAMEPVRRYLGIQKLRHGNSLLSPGTYVFALIFWFWHFGGPFDLTLQNNQIYWIMQVSIIFSSIALWAALLNGHAVGNLHFFAASVFTGFQMSLLGALLTLSGTSWYSVYFSTTWPWGMTPLEDQQLGGALMWVVGGVILAGFLLYSFARFFAILESRTSQPSQGFKIV